MNISRPLYVQPIVCGGRPEGGAARLWAEASSNEIVLVRGSAGLDVWVPCVLGPVRGAQVIRPPRRACRVHCSVTALPWGCSDRASLVLASHPPARLAGGLQRGWRQGRSRVEVPQKARCFLSVALVSPGDSTTRV